ncbi:MAG: YhbD family protein [Alicyclobacillus herbarius]|uniref:YhbD family protein n=1 Tax=Alicyclobacillus herbarius TaxID=122960 RepID=UPI002356E454|nr:YhbD family protein [Alicyclobacillus herbarius]MCL6633295.1 YhbD family protein [Alicyclobacillus herbarius]
MSPEPHSLDEDLISKKDLLEQTGISYGQLYRWKRKNLIPEEWFIRRSTFTGQETFFPRQQILSRIEKIQSLKDDLSLDELAAMFSPNPAQVHVRAGELIERNIVTQVSLDCLSARLGELAVLTFEQVLYAYVVEKVLRTGSVSRMETGLVVQVLADNYPKFEGRACDLLVIRKLGVTSCGLLPAAAEVWFDEETHVTVRLSLAECTEELKMKLAQEGEGNS